MDLTKLQRIVVDALDDLKAQDVRVFNTTGITGMFDRVVIASGTSNRHTRSLASHVADKVKAGGGEVISIEGAETGEWVLVDAGDIVVHAMQPSIRTYYNLEEIWGVKPVRLKTGAALPKAASGAKAAPKATKAAPKAAPKATKAKVAPKAAPKAATTRKTKPATTKAAKPAGTKKEAAKPVGAKKTAPKAAPARKATPKAGGNARSTALTKRAVAKPAATKPTTKPASPRAKAR